MMKEGSNNRFNICRCDQDLYEEMHLRIGRNHSSYTEIVNAALRQYLLPGTVPLLWHFENIPIELYATIRDYAEVQGRSIRDQIVIDLAECYSVDLVDNGEKNYARNN